MNNSYDISIILKKIKTIEQELVELKDIVKQSINTITLEDNTHLNLTQDNTDLQSSNQIDQYNKEVNQLITSLINTTKIAKILKNINQIRMKYLQKTGLHVYIQQLNSDIEKIENVLKSKKMSDKKINLNVSKSISSIDTRLIKYPGYTDTNLDIDELEVFKCCLTVNDNDILCKSFYFDYTLIQKCFTNYGLVVFNLKQNIDRVIRSCKGKIIYVEWCSDTYVNEDPFSFYVLDDIKGSLKYWKMDCRLSHLTDVIYNTLYDYLINSFRHIYYNIFSDNVFRSGYESNCQVTEFDCQQIIQNLQQMLDKYKLNKIIKDSVYKLYKHTSNELSNDKFNIKTDDLLEKNRKFSIDNSKNNINSLLFDSNI